MSNNVRELHKIKKKTSDWFKSKAKSEISKTIKAYKPRIEASKLLQEDDRKKHLYY
jgi:predicted component of type VI protein secretion system